MEQAFLVFILGIIVFGFLSLFIFIKKRLNIPQKDDSQSLLLLQNQMNEMTRTLDSRLQESGRLMHNQFSASANIIKGVTEELVKLGETNKQVVGFADQLRNLQDILKNPKHRGILGEYYLETLLKNVFPPGKYKMQYEFKDGAIVDAVIFIKDKIIPIDSKFSLENYRRFLDSKNEEETARLEKIFRQDVKNRIDETAKYIKPEEGTMDFAFMFIPAEAIYYELLVKQDLIEYAVKDKKVIIVSPTSFFAYLQTVLQGLKAMQIEESAKEIIKRVQELGKHLSAYETYMQKLGGHLGTTVNAYNFAYKELGKVDKDVLKISGQGIGVEIMSLEKPKEE